MRPKHRTGTDDSGKSEVTPGVPRGANNGAIQSAPGKLSIAPSCTEQRKNDARRTAPTPKASRTIGTGLHYLAADCTDRSEEAPPGFEPGMADLQSATSPT